MGRERYYCWFGNWKFGSPFLCLLRRQRQIGCGSQRGQFGWSLLLFLPFFSFFYCRRFVDVVVAVGWKVGGACRLGSQERKEGGRKDERKEGLRLVRFRRLPLEPHGEGCTAGLPFKRASQGDKGLVQWWITLFSFLSFPILLWDWGIKLGGGSPR